MSASEVSESDRAVLDFVPAEAVPESVDIPYFYSEVANTAGLYVFMTADGTVHKRIYGTADGKSGWFVASGPENIVYADSPPVNTESDRALYESSPMTFKPTTTTAAGYVGILPPAQGVESVGSVFGMPLRNVFLCAGAVTAALCIIILMCASSVKKRQKH